MLKKIFIVSVLIFISATTFAETRTFYFSRHGQRGDPKYQKSFKYCDEDALMPNGEEQAKLLGAYMAKLGFKGKIYVSPFYRTLQTASFAASKMQALPIILEPRIQEMTGVKDNTGIVRTTKKCITKKEIKQNFPAVQIPHNVKFPWRVENERQSQLDERISETIDDMLQNTSGDIFFVCHGGMMPGVIREMRKRGSDFEKRNAYNCCLYAFTFDTETKQVIESVDHTLNYLPKELITDNLTYYYKK